MRVLRANEKIVMSRLATNMDWSFVNEFIQSSHRGNHEIHSVKVSLGGLPTRTNIFLESTNPHQTKISPARFFPEFSDKLNF